MHAPSFQRIPNTARRREISDRQLAWAWDRPRSPRRATRCRLRAPASPRQPLRHGGPRGLGLRAFASASGSPAALPHRGWPGDPQRSPEHRGPHHRGPTRRVGRASTRLFLRTLSTSGTCQRTPGSEFFHQGRDRVRSRDLRERCRRLPPHPPVVVLERVLKRGDGGFRCRSQLRKARHGSLPVSRVLRSQPFDQLRDRLCSPLTGRRHRRRDPCVASPVVRVDRPARFASGPGRRDRAHASASGRTLIEDGHLSRW